jgi:hypothetical protein
VQARDIAEYLHQQPWRNRLIWGDKKCVLQSTWASCDCA